MNRASCGTAPKPNGILPPKIPTNTAVPWRAICFAIDSSVFCAPTKSIIASKVPSSSVGLATSSAPTASARSSLSLDKSAATTLASD